MEKELVIIGGGAAGLASAITAYDQGIHDILLIERENELGGILNQCIHNGFGLEEFHEQLTGPEYAYRFIKEVEKRKIEVRLSTTVLSIDENKNILYSNEKEGIVLLQAKAIIFAIGCFERNAGAIRLPGDRPNGIFTAGTAQKYLNREGYLVGKKVFILGSGDIGLIMARRMTLEGAHVLGVAEIQPYSNGLNRNIVQCLEDFSIPFYLSHTVKKVIGKKQLEKIIIAEVDKKGDFIEGSEKTFEVDTLLLSIGLIPSASMLLTTKATPATATKSVEVNQWYETSIPGIFIAGNVLHVHDLVDYVSEEAKMAALGAVHYLTSNSSCQSSVRVFAGENVSYILPERLDYPLELEKITFKFRVKKPMQNQTIYLKSGNQILKKWKRPFLFPAEMEKITVDSECLSSISEPLIVEVGD